MGGPGNVISFTQPPLEKTIKWFIKPPVPYAELATTTNFSFLRGASPAADLVSRAIALDHAGIGIADRNTMAGVVRAYAALEAIKRLCEESGRKSPDFKLLVGTRLAFTDGTPDIVAYPENRAGWGRLCRLLTRGNLRGSKGECLLAIDDLLIDTNHLLLIALPDSPNVPRLTETLACLAEAAPGAVWLGTAMRHRGDDRRRLARLKTIADTASIPLLAINDVLYDTPSQRDLQDVLTCIREGVTIHAAGRRLEANAERHLKPPTEMAHLFRDAPEALTEIIHVLARAEFSLGDLRYEYPEEPIPPGYTPQSWLETLTWRRTLLRYPAGLPEKVEILLRRELDLIGKLGIASYFLTIQDIVRVAEDKGILCQGRGSAANSAVCYMLGITAIDPNEIDLLFDRFISEERKEPPDIDVDFEHERREEVIQHIYERYGRERAGIAATVISYRPRSAIRDVGKALGLTEDITARIADTQWGSWGEDIPESHVKEAGLDPENPEIRRAVGFAKRLLGFPRHLSQHVGGFVLARGRLDELVPIGNAAMEKRTFIEWNKDDIDDLRLMKVDVLALGMLTCIRKSFDLLRAHCGRDLDLISLPAEDPEVYAMLQKGDSIGVFQVESRAQINMLPRLRPKCFYDLAIQVAIVRPGPIQGDMVHPYLRRRDGKEPSTLPSPDPRFGNADELEEVLRRTCGVPLFQEQAMKLAIVAAKFTPEQANQLRRAMATFRNNGTVGNFKAQMVEGMVRRGYKRDFAENCFKQIEGFGEYGFPESHAASFAKLVYVSSWIKCHHPAVFAAALLNAQPMGFYAPAQIVRDAQQHGVEVRPIDVNHSMWDNTLEPGGNGALALRLGLRQIDGMSEADAVRLAECRGDFYPDIETLAARTGFFPAVLHRLADADAFHSIGLDRRGAAWVVRRLPGGPALPLFAARDAQELAPEPAADLPEMPLREHVAIDYQTVRLSLRGHPMGMLRKIFDAEDVATCQDTAALADGARVRTAGVVLVRQRPGKGTAIFMTLEDETGIANVVIWLRQFERYRRVVMGARLLLVEGTLQKSPEGVVHVMAEHLVDRSAELQRLSEDIDLHVELSGSAEVTHPALPNRPRHPRDVRVLPQSRDFH